MRRRFRNAHQYDFTVIGLVKGWSRCCLENVQDVLCMFCRRLRRWIISCLLIKMRTRFLPRRSHAVAMMFWVISSALLCTYIVFWVDIMVSNKPDLKIWLIALLLECFSLIVSSARWKPCIKLSLITYNSNSVHLLKADFIFIFFYSSVSANISVVINLNYVFLLLLFKWSYS